MQECRANYKAAHAARTFPGAWVAFQESGIHAKVTAPASPSAARVKH
jgi:hypothetical protein